MFPIKSNEKENQPRLLTISTDVLNGAPIVFDKYKLKSEYPDKENPMYIITYRSDLLSEQVMASASIHINYEITRLKDDIGTEIYLWDRALLSNTSLTELLLYNMSNDRKSTEDVLDIESVHMINTNLTK